MVQFWINQQTWSYIAHTQNTFDTAWVSSQSPVSAQMQVFIQALEYRWPWNSILYSVWLHILLHTLVGVSEPRAKFQCATVNLETRFTSKIPDRQSKAWIVLTRLELAVKVAFSGMLIWEWVWRTFAWLVHHHCTSMRPSSCLYYFLLSSKATTTATQNLITLLIACSNTRTASADLNFVTQIGKV